MPIDWDPSDRQFHLHNGPISLVLRVFEDGTLGQLHLGGAASGRPLVPAPRAGPVRRVLEPGRLAGPAGLPDERHR